MVQSEGATASDFALKRRVQRRVATASLSGTVIEFYDFIIYGTAAALVFPHVFFPALGNAAGTFASIATFGVAFVARPFGAIIFGHLGDRLGRKKTLIATLLMMGVATILVGLTPTAAQIGVAAPLFLVFLRIVQGLAAGGEWAGAVLFSGEHAPKDKRGFWGMFPVVGGPIAGTLANATFLITGLGMSDDAFLSWGWRIPFLLSFVLVIVGLWVRLAVDETPVFKQQIASNGAAKVPFLEAFRRQPREILLASGIGLSTFAFTYVTGTYLNRYGLVDLNLARTSVLGAAALAGLFHALGTVLSAIYSDRVGRRPVLMGANVIAVLWALAIFPILELNSVVAFAVVLCSTLFIAGLIVGPMGAFLPELFETRYRYTATALAYNITGLIGGALTPLIAAPLVTAYGPFSLGLFLAGLSAVAVVCSYVLRETQGSDIGAGTPQTLAETEMRTARLGLAESPIELPATDRV